MGRYVALDIRHVCFVHCWHTMPSFGGLANWQSPVYAAGVIDDPACTEAEQPPGKHRQPAK